MEVGCLLVPPEPQVPIFGRPPNISPAKTQCPFSGVEVGLGGPGGSIRVIAAGIRDEKTSKGHSKAE